MKPLSTPTKEAIKTALAITVAYGVSMWMGWEKPMWAGLTVVFISAATVGHSIRMGVLRMLGTLGACLVAIVVISAFAQHRWWFMVALSAFIGLCVYRMLGSRNGYAYLVAACVAAIICFAGGLESLAVFEAVMERFQETALGVLAYTLIAVFLWPQSTEPTLHETSHQISSIQRQLFQQQWESFTGSSKEDAGQGMSEGIQQLRVQEAELLTQLEQVRVGAEADSHEVWQRRHEWQHFQQLSESVADALERWRTTFTDTRTLDLKDLLPTLETDFSELNKRFAEIESMLGGRPSRYDPNPLDLATSENKVGALNHFQKAALTTTRSELRHLDAQSRALFECVASLKGFGPEASMTRAERVSTSMRLSLDLERLGAATRVMAGIWIGFLIWIYIDPPAGPLMMIFLSCVGVVTVQVPWLAIAKLFVPFTVAAILAGLIYIFLMPQLSGFAQLGSVIFAVMFVIFYLLADPKLAGLKIIGSVVFLLLISVDNQQTYSFMVYANKAVALGLAIFVMIAASQIPTSPRPEKAFVRLLNRFFRHAEVQISRLSLDWRAEHGWSRWWKMILYPNDLTGLSQRIGTWSAQIDHRSFQENTAEQVQTLVGNLDVLARRIDMLTEARRRPQAQVLVEKLLVDVRAWRLALQETFRAWSIDPAATDNLRTFLAARLADMENRIAEVLSGCEEKTLTDQDYENFYRLLGASRSLTEAVMAYGRLADGVTWEPWKETRL